MLRVLHITRDFPPRSTGGISTAVGALVRASTEAGVRCGVVSFDAWRPRAAVHGAAEPAPVSRESQQGADIWRLRRADQLGPALEAACADGVDVVHLHDALLWRAVRPRLPAAPMVWTVHVCHGYQDALRQVAEPTHGAKAESAVLPTARKILAPSHTVARLLRPLLATPEPALCVVPLAIELPEHRGPPAGERAPVVLHAGRFGDLRGTDLLFQVMEGILGSVPDAKFVVAGGLPENARAERRWRRRWQELSGGRFDHRVRWPGWLSRDALKAELDQARVFLSPGRWETFGLGVLEAMAHGAVVAATAAGGVAELVDDLRTGALAVPGDAAALTTRVQQLLTIDTLASRLGEAGSRAVAQRQTLADVAAELVGIYEEVAA